MLISRHQYAAGLAFLALTSSSAWSSDWYVSPAGRDEWSGKSPAPNASATDGPFASLERARDAARAELAGPEKGPVTVHLRAGVYRRSSPLELGEKDSGGAGAQVVWRGYQNERPKISGARLLTGWAVADLPGRAGVLKADLPDKVDLANCRQLLLHGRRLPLARYPNADLTDMATKGWAFAGGQQWPMYADIPGEDKRTLQMKPEDIRVWANPSDAEVFVFARYNWWNDLVALAGYDAGSGIARLAKDCSYPIRAGNRYYVQGPIEELDAPGEWHLDRRTRTVYLIPQSEQTAEGAEIVVASGLLKAKDVRHLSIENVDWEGSHGTAVVFENCDSCRFAGNKISNVGFFSGSGVGVSGGRKVEVRSNTVSGAGANAVSVSGGDRQTLEECGHLVENNHLYEFGVYYKQGVGVMLRAGI
jgi:hypothetical protein